MTDEGKITCNGLGVVPSDRVRPTPPGWREGPLPSYERCPGCSACPPTAEQLIEARVRAEVAGKIARDIRRELVCCDIYERLSKSREEGDWRNEQTRGHHLCYWGEASARIAEDHAAIAAGSSPDTTPAERCGICGGHLTAGGCERRHDTAPEPKP